MGFERMNPVIRKEILNQNLIFTGGDKYWQKVYLYESSN